MKQINLWQSFIVQILALHGNQIFKESFANDYIEANTIALSFFDDLDDDTQVIRISKEL